MLDKMELKKRITEYMLKYEAEYQKINNPEIIDPEVDIVAIINRYYEASYYDPKYGENAFFQIFSAINALDDEKNPYYQITQEIENNFGLDREIIEVGSGMFPALSYEISKRQKEIGKGTITAYDPALVIKSLPGIKLIKADFTLATPIPKNALIIGRKPCKATEIMIKSALKNKAELYLDICLCNHAPHEYITKNSSHNYNKIWEMYIDNIINDSITKEFQVEKSTLVDPLINQENKIIKIKKIQR